MERSLKTTAILIHVMIPYKMRGTGHSIHLPSFLQSGKEFACDAGDLGSIQVRKTLWYGNPL